MFSQSIKELLYCLFLHGICISHVIFARLINKHSISANSKEQWKWPCKKKESMWARAPVMRSVYRGSVIIPQQWRQDHSQECRRGEEPKSGEKEPEIHFTLALGLAFTRFSSFKFGIHNGNCIQIYIISRDHAVFYALCYKMLP